MSCYHKNTWLDHVIQIFSVFTVCTCFLAGIRTINFIWNYFTQHEHYRGAVGIWIWIPALSIALGYTGQYIGLLRDNMIDVLKDLTLKQQSTGINPFRIIMQHALKNAFIPLLTKLGITFGTFLGGTVIIESVFSINGVGFYVMESIKDKDIPVIQAFVLLISFTIVILNLLVDLLYAYIDPRITLR
ncbi:MAG: ABC transporter permease [Acutalibacteraceae bacterium]